MDPVLAVVLFILAGVALLLIGFQVGYRAAKAEDRLLIEQTGGRLRSLNAEVQRLQNEARDAHIRGMVLGRADAQAQSASTTRAAGMSATGVGSETRPARLPVRSRVVLIDGDMPETEATQTGLPDVEIVQVTVDLSGAVPVENLTQATTALRRGHAIVAALSDGMTTLRVCRIPVGFYTEVRVTDSQPVRLLLDTAKDVNAWLRRHFRS